MKNKKILILISILIIVIGVIGIIGYNLLSKEDSILGKYIANKEFEQELFIEEDTIYNSGYIEQTEEEILEIIKQNEEDNVNFGKIESMIRTICNNFNNIQTAVNSTSFKLIKKEIDNISNNVNVNQDNFTYVVLPGLIFDNCNNEDDTFSNNLLKIFQIDGEEIIISTQEELNGLYKFINNIEFNNSNIDTKKLKTSSNYFYEIFFQQNIRPIVYSYFFETSYNLNDLNNYIYTTTLLSFGEANNLLEQTVSNFQNFVKKLGFEDLEDFNNYILKYNGYSDLDALKDDLVIKYNKLSTQIENELGFNLEEQMLTLDKLNSFYNSENYKKLQNNTELYSSFKEIAEGHLYFAIIGGDYANNLSEGWSGKMFFGDSLIGNSIIRVFYIYYFDKLTF